MQKKSRDWKISSAREILQKSHPSLTKVNDYCLGVISREITTNELVRLAVERHLNDLVDGPARGLHFDQASAQRIIRFFPRVLSLVEGEGSKPFVLSPWQQFVQGSIFGWKNPNGFRRFKTAYLEIGKGSGKSPLAAGTGLYGLVADGESGAQIYIAAGKKEQAGIVFRDADNMVQASPYLSQRIQRNTSNLAVLSTASFMRPVSADTRISGPRPHMVIGDELHEMRDAALLDKLTAGFKGRRQPLAYEITNSGCDIHSLCYHHHEYTEKILHGILENDEWFGLVFGLDICPKCKAEGKTQPNPECEKCDKWTDERVWPKANPNLGISIQYDYLRKQVTEALGMPSQENLVKMLNFCIWVEAVNKWMPIDEWDACGADYDEDSLAGARCYGGLDLASLIDLCAFVLYFPDTGLILCWFWVPKENIAQRVNRDRVPYDKWVERGLIKATPGNVTDYDVIREDIKALADKFQIEEIGFDEDNAVQLATQLENEGLKMVTVPQRMSALNAPMKELEKMVRGRQIQHDCNPVLRWNMSNLVAVQDATTRIRPDRAKSTEKIDGAAALIDSLNRAIVHVDSGSSYDDGELFVL
jgi:phage terminase large subunit-like protein